MVRRLAFAVALLFFTLPDGVLRAAQAERTVEPGHVEAAGGGHELTAATGEHGRKHEVVEFDIAQAIWVLIIFLILLAILYPTAWKQVLAGLKAREDRIRKDIADAEAARARAEATLREYTAQLASAESKVREMISGATVEGERIAAGIRAKGQQEAEEARERAMREIDAARKQAVTELYERAAELSTSVAGKILRRNISADDQRDLVRQSLAELESVESK